MFILNMLATASVSYETYDTLYNDTPVIDTTNWGVVIFFSLLFWGILWGAISQTVGTSKGRKDQFWWGFLLGFIGLIIVLCLPGGEKNIATTTAKRETSELNKLEYLEKLQKLKESGTISTTEFKEMKEKAMAGWKDEVEGDAKNNEGDESENDEYIKTI